MNKLMRLLAIAGTVALTATGAAWTDPNGMLDVEVPEPSGGSEPGSSPSGQPVTPGPEPGLDQITGPEPAANWDAQVRASFESFKFDDNITLNGTPIIPPDPIGAAGPDRIISVVNSMIEARDKSGNTLWRESLTSFFASLPPANRPFDPKVVYDQYEDRFLVVALSIFESASNPNPANTSQILVAVSKDAMPVTATTADWWYHLIDSKQFIAGQDYWADYPGFEADEEAVYITANMFQHIFRGFGGVRLWIIDKGVAGGFYAGGAATVTIRDPYAANPGNATTTMPAQVFGNGGVGPGIGTFLVSYSGRTAGGPGGIERVQVVRVDNPLGGSPVFTREVVDVGDIEDVGDIFGFPALSDAPQPGTGVLIEVNDRRALDAVWRNGDLWLTTTIEPNSGGSAGETTAHWFRLDASAVVDSTSPGGLITMADQGDIHGEDLVDTGDEITTYFPSVAVNNAGDAKFGFSASGSTLHAGAFVTGRVAGDPAGTLRLSGVVHEGVDFYIRTFGSGRNRWGDYTGIALDPGNDRLFWVFNQYADERGTPTGLPPEDGRWATAWINCSFGLVKDGPVDFNRDGKADILWRHVRTGLAVIWLMDGFTVVSRTPIGRPPLVWRVAGLGDTDGDGKTDILWRNTRDGTAQLWRMDGTNRLSSTTVGKPPLVWQVDGLGDTDGDSKSDILWLNTSNRLSLLWRMNGAAKLAVRGIGKPPFAWQVDGLGDTDADGKADILWRETETGELALWLMDGFAKRAVKVYPSEPLELRVVGLGDFNGDKKSDILWRNRATGDAVLWEMDKFTVLGKTVIGNVQAVSDMPRLGDTDGDKKTDVLWRNLANDRYVVWRMDGAAILGQSTIGNVTRVWQVQ